GLWHHRNYGDDYSSDAQPIVTSIAHDDHSSGLVSAVNPEDGSYSHGNFIKLDDGEYYLKVNNPDNSESVVYSTVNSGATVGTRVTDDDGSWASVGDGPVVEVDENGLAVSEDNALGTRNLKYDADLGRFVPYYRDPVGDKPTRNAEWDPYSNSWDIPKS